MTREEALRKVEGYLTDYLPSDDFDELEAIMATLKQTDVLDKIRTEIVHSFTFDRVSGVELDADDYKSIVLGIIDKYKAESEDKE